MDAPESAVPVDERCGAVREVGGTIGDADYVGRVGCGNSVVDSGMSIGMWWTKYHDTWSG